MVTELYLLRHGIAVDPGFSGMPDDARPLTDKGKKRMRQIASGLRVLELELDRIVTSPLPRARETAELVALALGAKDRLETSNVLQTGSDAATIERWLRDRPEGRLMLVGHNPTLSELVSLLVVGARKSPICELKKGGIAALQRVAGPVGLFELSWMAPPRLLRRIGGDLSADE
jgi:phosphohistidine phosphatase